MKRKEAQAWSHHLRNATIAPERNLCLAAHFPLLQQRPVAMLAKLLRQPVNGMPTLRSYGQGAVCKTPGTIESHASSSETIQTYLPLGHFQRLVDDENLVHTRRRKMSCWASAKPRGYKPGRSVPSSTLPLEVVPAVSRQQGPRALPPAPYILHWKNCQIIWTDFCSRAISHPRRKAHLGGRPAPRFVQPPRKTISKEKSGNETPSHRICGVQLRQIRSKKNSTQLNDWAPNRSI